MKPNSSFLGSAAMTLASALRMVIQVTILPIIGRLLGPHAYGQIALVSPFIVLSIVIAESGLGACIIKNTHLTKELEGTAFCFSSALSLTIIALFGILAYPLGHILHEPDFPPLLMGMSGILLLASLNIVPAALLLRAKRYTWIALSDVISSVGGASAVAVGIYLGWGVWSLVVQQIVFWVCKVIVVTIGAHWRPHFIFRRNIIKENMSFGANLTGSSILSFISRNIDNVLIGAFLGTEALGYYALAYQIISLPQMVIAGSVYYSIFSATSEARRTGEDIAPRFLKTLRIVMLIGIPTIIGLAVTAPLSVPLFLSDKWIPMVKLIALLVPLGLAQTISTSSVGVLQGFGRSDLIFKIDIISSTATIIAILIAVCFNSSAVAIGVSVMALLGSGLLLIAAIKECHIRIAKIWKTIAAPFVSSLVMGGGVELFELILPDTYAMGVKLIVSVVMGIFVYCTVLFVLFHNHIKADIADIKTILSKRRQRVT